VFFIKIDVMHQIAELFLSRSQGEAQLEEFTGQLREAITDGALSGRVVLFDHGLACFMTSANERWLGHVQQLLLDSGALKIAEVVGASGLPAPALSPNWQRFEKVGEARSWLVRRDEPTPSQRRSTVTRLPARQPHRGSAFRRAG